MTRLDRALRELGDADRVARELTPVEPIPAADLLTRRAELARAARLERELGGKTP